MSDWLPMISFAVAVLTLFSGFAAAWGVLSWRQNQHAKKIEKLDEVKLGTEDHVKLCRINSLEINQTLTTAISGLKDEIFPEIRGIKDELRRRNGRS